MLQIKPRTHQLHDLGQRLWLESVSLPLLNSGKLARYIAELSVSGLSANPALFEQALGASDVYDAPIARLVDRGRAGEDLFYELVLADLRPAAALLRPLFDASAGADGWVSLEVSPLLADNTAHTIQAAHRLVDRAALANLMVKIPGTPEGLRAVEELVVDGVPVNVTLLFSPAQYLAAAQAWQRGIMRRLAAGLEPAEAAVPALMSLFVSRWDSAVQDLVTPVLQNRLGIVMAMRSYQAHCALLASAPWQQLAAAGVPAQRLQWAGVDSGGAALPDTLYVQALAAAGTLCVMSEHTLLAVADHGCFDALLPTDGAYADALLQEFIREGVAEETLASRLQRDGVDACALAWHALLTRIGQKCAGAAG